MPLTREPLLHIISINDAGRYCPAPGLYAPPSLEAEGFIHLSTVNQVVPTANRFFYGRDDLWIFVIDPAKLTASVRFEDLYGHGDFPHLYGPLNSDAIFRVVSFPCQPDGTFALPTYLVELAHAR